MSNKLTMLCLIVLAMLNAVSIIALSTVTDYILIDALGIILTLVIFAPILYSIVIKD